MQSSSAASSSGALLNAASPAVLLLALVVSATTLMVRLPKHGKISLPTYQTESEAVNAVSSHQTTSPSDPFDLYDADIWTDGVSLDDGEQFWKSMTLIKGPLAILVGLLLATRLVALVLPVIQGSPLPAGFLFSAGISVFLYTYILALAIAFSSMRTQPRHWATCIHLASLLGTAVVVRSLETLLPNAGKVPSSSTILRWLPVVELSLAVIATAIVVLLPRGPKLHFPMQKLYNGKVAEDAIESEKKFGQRPNVSGESDACIFDQLFFGYATKVVNLGYTSDTLDVHDLPVVPHHIRAMPLFAHIRRIYGKTHKRKSVQRGSGWTVLLRVIAANKGAFIIQAILACITAGLYYAPAYFVQKLVRYLELDPARETPAWGWVFCLSLFFVSATNYILTGLLWSISTTVLQSRIKIMLNTMLFAKTLVRKDVAGGAPPTTSIGAGEASPDKKEGDKEDEENVTSKSQVMTLMTVDVDRVADFAFHIFTLIDAPLEIVVGSLFLWNLMGISAIFGLLVSLFLMPLNHLASKFVVEAQDSLMKARDERTALMNEILQGIRMLKFMSWERQFEKKVLSVRDKELSWQKRNYVIEVCFSAIWALTPVAVTLVAFLHYVWWREMPLTPSIAFTAVAVFAELRFALNALPETFISVLQGFVSLRRIEKYLATAEVEPVPVSTSQKIALNSATITWPRDRASTESQAPSTVSTPKSTFILQDLTLAFPEGQLSLICGRLGAGKSLLLLALLGEADVLAGQLICPRSAPDAMSKFNEDVNNENWVVPSVTAYVPQSAWLQSASIKTNILFGLPYHHQRYQDTVAACSLVSDFAILEDADETEIGEKGVALSGGQRARVSLARAVYSRASIILLDDVLAAVDALTAHHIYDKCLKGPLMRGRTVILVSHHVGLTLPGANYIVALDNGTLEYAGNREGFLVSGILKELEKDKKAQKEQELLVEDAGIVGLEGANTSESGKVAGESASTEVLSAAVVKAPATAVRKAPRKLMEDEKRAVGRISKDIWMTYFRANGGLSFWVMFAAAFILAMFTPLLESLWLRHWTASYEKENEGDIEHSALYYIGIYSLITVVGVVLSSVRYGFLYAGALNASDRIHKKMLEAILLANIRFHDTTSRGRVLNRFGKDMEGVDSSLPDNLGRTITYSLNILITFVSITAVAGVPFSLAALVLGFLYYQNGKVYGQSSRDMRRLDSVTRSPLYSLYGETVAGVAVLRAFGASTTALRQMMTCVDQNLVCFYWMWTLNRWLSARYNMISSLVLLATGAAVLITPSISAGTAGLALAFAASVAGDMLFIVRRFVALEQSMVAIERIKEYSEVPSEAPEFVEPRPAASWPSKGKIAVEDLVLRYAPDLPDVLHKVSFTVPSGSKVGIVGPTGCGKSTLALSFFRFIEATSGRILIDDIDIAKIGLTDLRSRVTIIPQDPTILSGTLRSTLDVFSEYEDAEIFEALSRVHLIPAEGSAAAAATLDADGEAINANVFRNLDSVVSESGDNFSQGEKQLICMARAILRRNKLLIMDEATASIDYETDALINQTIREEFSGSTILTIAHRLRTIIDFDAVIVMDAGKLIEYDSPAKLLRDPSSRFHKLCKAAGNIEYATLEKLAFEAEKRRENEGKSA